MLHSQHSLLFRFRDGGWQEQGQDCAKLLFHRKNQQGPVCDATGVRNFDVVDVLSHLFWATSACNSPFCLVSPSRAVVKCCCFVLMASSAIVVQMDPSAPFYCKWHISARCFSSRSPACPVCRRRTVRTTSPSWRPKHQGGSGFESSTTCLKKKACLFSGSNESSSRACTCLGSAPISEPESKCGF